MNYIKEINAFYDWLETNSISSSSIVLWHSLMSINNKTGWKPEFTVAISTLEIKTSLTKKTIERARNNLKTVGLIDWKSRKGNQSAAYKMVSVMDILWGNNDSQNIVWGNNDPQSVSQPVSQSVPQPVPQGVAITKLKETKQNETKRSSGLPHSQSCEFFVKNFNNHAPYIQEKIVDWEKHFSEEIVIASMKIALEKNAKHFNFCEAILKEWFSEGLKSIDEVRQHEKDKRQSMNSKRQFKNFRSNEREANLPKWMEHKEKPKQESQSEDQEKAEWLEKYLNDL